MDALAQGAISADAANAFDELIAGLQDVLEQYGRGKAFGDVVSVLKNGKQEYWKINDPLLLRSLTSMDPKKLPWFLEAYGAATRFMTAGITGNNVVWSVFSNFPRDLQTLLNYSDTKNPFRLLRGIGSAYVNRFKGSGADPLYKEYLAMGGGQTSVYSADRNLAKKVRADLTGDKLRWLNPLEWISLISDTIESGPRFATYRLCREKGMDPESAIYAAHDVTVNFRRAGAESRAVNRVIPFFNAQVQGLDKFARWLGAADTPKAQRKAAALKRFLAFLTSSAAIGALMYAINSPDDEARDEYQQLSNYTKNSYWVFPLGDGKYFAIPKARELSVLTSFFESLAEYAGGNPHAFDEFWSYAADNFLPSVASDLASLPEEGFDAAAAGAMSSLGVAGVFGSILANRDFLGRPIVSASMQYLEPRDQYNRRTSKLAKLLGEAAGVSPLKLDYFFQQTMGGWWKYQKALFPVGGENVDLTLGVQNSYVKDNQYSTDLLNWLYDKAEASAAAKKSHPDDMERAITAAVDARMTAFYGNYYKLAKDKAETEESRGTRKTVLGMIAEYRKAADNAFATEAQTTVYGVLKKLGTTEYLPSALSVTVKDGAGEDHLLSAEDYVEYQLDYNRRYWEYVELALPEAKGIREQAATLKAAKNLAKTEATDRALGQLKAPDSGHAARFRGINAADAIRFNTALDLANDDGSLTQREVIDAINALGLSRRDSSTLFHTRYESDRNNPYA